MQKRKGKTPKILVFTCSPSDALNADITSWLKEENELFTIECVPGGGFWVGADTDELAEKGEGLVDRVINKLKSSPQKIEKIKSNIHKIKEGTSGEKDEIEVLEEMAGVICNPEIDEECLRAVLLNGDGSINEGRTTSVFSSIQHIQVGFMNKDTGDFINLNDAKFNYFNKYSDEQLDDIYKVSPDNREVIDKVREYRKRLKDNGR